MRIGLVGCVKTKRDHPAPARDLYVSPLFSGRRAYVEATCDRWFVLSAEHGLVLPDTVIAPYDVALASLSSRERRRWADAVVGQLRRQIGELGNHEFEIHAGSQYRDFGLIDHLEAAGAAVEMPTEGLAQGEQLAFYQRGTRPPHVGPTAPAQPSSAPQPRATAVSAEARRPGGKYGPLRWYLSGCGEDRPTLTFAEVDRILGVPLPASSRTYREWWANTDRNPQARAWLDAGYRVDAVDLMAGRVTFWRGGPSQEAAPSRSPSPRAEAEVDVTDLTVLGPFSFRWPSGEEWFDRGWDFVVTDPRRRRVRHGLGSRLVFGRDRVHSVTWLDGAPQVEAAAADDYEWTHELIGLIRRADGRDARSIDELPDGYADFEVVVHRDAVHGPWARRSLAVRLHEEDLAGWARHAVIQAKLRQARRRQTGGSSAVPTPSSGPRATTLRSTTGGEPSSPRRTIAPAVVDALLDHAQDLASDSPANLAADPEADAFLRSDPFAFLLAVVFDQGIVAERAWAAPWLLRERLGHLDPVRMVADPAAVRIAVAGPPALHRYVENVPRWIVAAAQQVLDRYDGEAERIWNDAPTAVELRQRLEAFDGIGQKKAAMAVEILERNRGVVVRELAGSDVAFDVHIRRVFLRAGLADADDLDHVVEQARIAYPDRPGALDLPAWDIGRNWCRPQNPQCIACPLNEACPQLIDRADVVKGS